MILTVNFRNSGVTKDMEFDEPPMVDDVLTIREGGVDTRFHVLAVSGSINADGETRPGIMTVERIDE